MGEKIINYDRKKSVLADLSLLLVALSWGGGFIVVKNALADITPMWMMAIRFSFGFLAMAIVFHKNLIKISKKDLKSGLIIGVFLFLGYATQTIGLQYTTAGKQAFLTGTNVVIVPFLVWFITKKHPGWHSIVGALLTLIGIGLLTLQGGFSINVGDGLTLICAVFFAAHITSVGYFAADCDSIAISVVQAGVAAIIFVIGALIFEPMPKNINGNIEFAITYLVLFSTVGAILIQNIAQKFTPPTHAAIVLSMESVIGTILAVIILKDVFSFTMVIGCFFIFAAIIITETKLSFLKLTKTKQSDE
jgi:drug/metabolite transporter (DMT)-like permease